MKRPCLALIALLAMLAMGLIAVSPRSAHASPLRLAAIEIVEPAADDVTVCPLEACPYAEEWDRCEAALHESSQAAPDCDVARDEAATEEATEGDVAPHCSDAAVEAVNEAAPPENVELNAATSSDAADSDLPWEDELDYYDEYYGHYDEFAGEYADEFEAPAADQPIEEVQPAGDEPAASSCPGPLYHDNCNDFAYGEGYDPYAPVLNEPLVETAEGVVAEILEDDQHVKVEGVGATEEQATAKPGDADLVVAETDSAATADEPASREENVPEPQTVDPYDAYGHQVGDTYGYEDDGAYYDEYGYGYDGYGYDYDSEDADADVEPSAEQPADEDVAEDVAGDEVYEDYDSYYEDEYYYEESYEDYYGEDFYGDDFYGKDTGADESVDTTGGASVEDADDVDGQVEDAQVKEIHERDDYTSEHDEMYDEVVYGHAIEIIPRTIDNAAASDEVADAADTTTAVATGACDEEPVSCNDEQASAGSTDQERNIAPADITDEIVHTDDLKWADEAPVLTGELLAAVEEAAQPENGRKEVVSGGIESEYGSDYAEQYYRSLDEENSPAAEVTAEVEAEVTNSAECADECADEAGAEDAHCEEAEAALPKCIDVAAFASACGRQMATWSQSISRLASRIRTACGEIAKQGNDSELR